MINWVERYAQRTRWVTSSAIRDMLGLSQQADTICFAGGLPAPELFPIERFRQATDLVLNAHGQQALQYGPTEGYTPLRWLAASYLGKYGLRFDESNVLITTGSQQAMELVGRLFLDRGDQVIVESPTYVGALHAFRVYQPDFTVARDDDGGLVVQDLAPLFSERTKFLYLMPTYQNPRGTTLSLERRQELLTVAEERGIPIVEDDPCSVLRYDGDPLPPLVVLDAQRGSNSRWLYNGGVLYHSTFSKLLAPGLRIGWVVAPAPVIQKLAVLKQGVDLHTSTLAQMIAYEVARDGFLEQHAERLRTVYHHRRDLMLKAMEEHFPAEVRWSRPPGGVFIWVQLPERVDARSVLAESLRQMVAFVPGEPFFPNGGGHNTLRLNFSNAKPDRIEEGIRRLGNVLKRFCASGIRQGD